VNQWIYQTKGFAILLAFLGTNILCAALIRYPWKKRQTGFVITHAGLLVLLASILTGINMTRIVYAQKIDKNYAWLKGCGPEFLDSLPPLP